MAPRGKSEDFEQRRQPTIHDVARHAGVSKSLVSMVTRGEEGVSAEKREAILEAIEALGYRPNVMARSLVQRRTRILGVMIPDLRNPFFSDVVSGIQTRAAELGFRVLFNTGLRQPDFEEDAIESMLELRADGLILAAPRVDDPVITHAGHWVPVVVINRSPPDDSCDAVSNDNIAGAALAVEHLVDLGHRRIALIEGGAGIAARTRHEGYIRAMRRLGLDEYILTAKGAHSEEGGRSGAHQLLQAEPFPTAIFASNDLCAIGALDALEEAGLTIPDDVSLVGFDNTTLAALRHISLTSINQPGSDMGMSAVERLWERIEGERTTPRRDVVAPNLVIRSTTGPPPDGRQSVTPSDKPFEPTSHLSGSE